MYRFTKTRNVVLYNSYMTSIPTLASRVCSFCNFYHVKIPKFPNVFQIRQNSSNTTTTQLLVHEKVKKRVKRKNKRYAELLEVTDSATSNKRAFVKNLSVQQLEALIDKPDIELDEIYKVRDFIAAGKDVSTNISYSDTDPLAPQHEHTIEDIISNDKAYVMQEYEKLEIAENETADIVETPNVDTITQTDVKQEKKRKSRKKQNEVSIDKKSKNGQKIYSKNQYDNWSRTITSFMDVCIHSDMLDKCYSALMFKKYATNNITPYNIIMKKYAENSNFKKVNAIMSLINERKIALVPQSYAIMLECLGRLENNPYLNEKVSNILEKMEKDKITLNRVINESYFNDEDLIFVLKAIRTIKPDFVPKIEMKKMSYDNVLLEKLRCDNNAAVSPAKDLLTMEDMNKKIRSQLSNEFSGLVTVKSVEAVSFNNKLKNARAKVENLEKKWREIVMQRFEKKLFNLKNRESYSSMSNIFLLHPYLSVLKPEIYVDAIMKEVRNLVQGSEGYSPSLLSLQYNLGAYIFKRYEMCIKVQNGMTDKITDIHTMYCDWYLNRTDGCNSRVRWQNFIHDAKNRGVYLNYYVPPWPSNILLKVGRFLYDIILCDIKVESSSIATKSVPVPAFCIVYKNRSSAQLKQEIKPHAQLAKLYRDSKPEKLQFDTNMLPSLCPPRPWLSIHDGGYLCTKVDIVRLQQTCNIWKQLNATPVEQLYPALDSLNQLGSIPWRVNNKILDIALQIFRKGGNSKLDIPELPDSLPSVPQMEKDPSKEDKIKHYKLRMERRKKRNEMMSLWWDALYKLSLANHLRDEIFWLPHNMDFRGRVYPIPPHMTHVSSDLSRSMLIFAQKKPIGPKGLDWLKLQIINLTGFKKKESIQTRIDYANEIIDKIIDSAENPLNGEMWWTTSDEPWQTLAACMELNEALKSPNPEEFLSGFPIHQDGSCNGLQHYAALGRDIVGAKSVNLSPSELPQDVYSAVAVLVEKKRQTDAENGLEVAKVLEKFIKRKVIKQTVMTTVYGVTKFGARLQIAKQLKDIDDFPQEYVWQASLYLVMNTFDSLRSMFTSAREIQDWFTECAKLISSVHEKNVEWITPLGLPVIQPYTKLYNSKTEDELRPMKINKPNVMKQKNAFPPNFVHSLDSSHMMLTSLHCEHAGLTFVSVHDCFWTHCSTVEPMSKICREQFVSLHSQPILENLSEFFIERYGVSNKICDKEEALINDIFKKVPNKGEFDLNEVLSSVYFFS